MQETCRHRHITTNRLLSSKYFTLASVCNTYKVVFDPRQDGGFRSSAFTSQCSRTERATSTNMHQQTFTNLL
ncbi:hypothetical protein HanHA300_Chr08g0279011 [Helianthus annuus]|nr:hypothetical protein HanHA300_Chr08g0279011 [Helianthus annuus]KAJ0546782.1 hypothetical protein HanIR_Chr08g0364781 [Helianthus annuus]KAJ0553418.1 hypothetical protein HanHA89_Chr08g0296191 [Helianthus annuus]KAJ0719079.1 hypothetical protein HanLR1_Chr08g0277771 [Helianthus annuus]